MSLDRAGIGNYDTAERPTRSWEKVLWTEIYVIEYKDWLTTDATGQGRKGVGNYDKVEKPILFITDGWESENRRHWQVRIMEPRDPCVPDGWWTTCMCMNRNICCLRVGYCGVATVVVSATKKYNRNICQQPYSIASKCRYACRSTIWSEHKRDGPVQSEDFYLSRCGFNICKELTYYLSSEPPPILSTSKE